MNNTAKSTDLVAAGMTCGSNPLARALAGGVFKVQCVGADGQIKWEEETPNLVVNVGLQDMNTKYFTGSGYTASWFVGLIQGAVTVVNTDTLAVKGWSEFNTYSGNRKAAVFGTASTSDPSQISNSASPASFTITAGGTVTGAFLCNVATTNTGLLFSASAFQAPGGSRTVVVNDVLNVTYTFNLDGTP